MQDIKQCKIYAGGITDRGKIREYNEDNLLIDREINLFVVADGVGGLKGGKKASEVVVKILPAQIREALSRIAPGSLSERVLIIDSALRALNRQVYEFAGEISEFKGMGTTIVSCMIDNGTAILSNMGDSRAYLMRDGEMERLTEDHSIVNTMLRMGEITSVQAKKHPLRHVITRYVGMEGDYGPDSVSLELKQGDRMLLCSDGLTDMVAERLFAAVLWEQESLDAVCRTLVAMAKKGGGRDNITVVVIQFGERNEKLVKTQSKVKVRRTRTLAREWNMKKASVEY